MQRFNGRRLDIAIVPPLAEPMDLDRISADMPLLDQPIQKSVDVLKRLIIVGGGGVGNCSEKGEYIVFKLYFVQAVAAVLLEARETASVVLHGFFTGVL